MGKSGGSNEVKETEAQRAQSEVAQRQWQLYKTDLQQYEDIFMDKVDELNNGSEYDKLAGTAALGTAQSFGSARQGLADNLAASGVDPTSGRYQEAMKDLETDQALSQTDTTNRAQSSQQDKYVAGLQDVASIGQGQKAEALQGYSDLASSSLNKAAVNAQTALANKGATQGAVGAVAGAGLAYGLNNYASGAAQANGTSYLDSTKTLTQNQSYNPGVSTYFGGR